MHIPTFMNSEHALDFGKDIDENTAKVLGIIRKQHLKTAEQLREAGCLDSGMISATQAQYCREAIESFQQNNGGVNVTM